MCTSEDIQCHGTRIVPGWQSLVVRVGLLIAGVSCDSDDREPGAPAGTGDGTPSADFTEPTAGRDEDDQRDVESNATVPPASADDGTPFTSGLPAPGAEGAPALGSNAR